MSDDRAVDKVNMQSDEQVSSRLTAGTMLRQAREAAHMQLPSLAGQLKVPQGKLQALEADDYAAFPDHVFMRALAMGMCRTLHIDAAPVLAALPRTEPKSLGRAGAGINTTVKERSHFRSAGASFGTPSHGSRKVVAGVLLLLAAAAAVYFVPLRQGGDAAGQAAAPAVPAAAATGTAGVAPSTSLVAEEPAATVAVAAAGNAGEGAVAVPVQPVATPASATGEPVTAAVVAAAEAPAPVPPAPAAVPVQAAGALLEMRASAQSWVKVRDAKGKVVLEKTLAKDEVATAGGELPLSVIVGNAKGTQVLVRGEPLDIAGTRDNVARFEVK